jgi:hypothetical protein
LLQFLLSRSLHQSLNATECLLSAHLPGLLNGSQGSAVLCGAALTLLDLLRNVTHHLALRGFFRGLPTLVRAVHAATNEAGAAADEGAQEGTTLGVKLEFGLEPVGQSGAASTQPCA